MTILAKIYRKKNLSDKATLLLSAVVRLWIEGLHRRLTIDTVTVFLEQDTVPIRLAPVLKTIFHQCVISYSCSQSYSDGSVLRTSYHILVASITLMALF